MKTAIEILKEVYCVQWVELSPPQGILDAMKEYASQALDLAAEKADLEYCSVKQYHKESNEWVDIADYIGQAFRIDKNSILKLKEELI